MIILSPHAHTKEFLVDKKTTVVLLYGCLTTLDRRSSRIIQFVVSIFYSLALVCVWGGGWGWGWGGSVCVCVVGGGNCCTGMRASMSKPIPFIYLAFEKTDPFIYLIVRNVDLFIY